MNILITGGCGFIGSHLVDYNLEQGHQVMALDSLCAGSKDNIQAHLYDPHFKLEIANMLNWDGLQEALSWADCVYHMAAIVGVKKVIADPIATLNVNIDSTQRLFKNLATLKDPPRVIIASSSMVYGESKASLQKENDILHIKSTAEGHWIYAISKLANEAVASAYYTQCSIPVTIARIFNTIGPRQSGLYGMVVPSFIQQACSNADITVYGDGTQTRSFCDVRDLVHILDLLSKQTASIGQIVNIGNDHNISISKLATLVKERAHSKSNITYIPYMQAYGTVFSDIDNRCPDLSKMLSLIDFQPRWSLESTIDDLIDIARNA